MRTNLLGTNKLPVSEIGLGCWQLGADWGEPIASEKARNILDTAFAAGITFFDTADVYGNGRSERIIGKFFADHSDKVRVATKFGRGGGVFPESYTEKALRKAVKDSKERLGVAALDLLQLHCIPKSVMQEGKIFDWLRKLVSEGEIKGFGASVETVEEGMLCIQQEGLQSLQIILNILRQKALDKLVPAARDKQVGLIVRLPLNSGLLAGKFTVDTEFPPEDHRNYNQNGEAFNVGETFGGLKFEKGVRLVQKLQRDALVKAAEALNKPDLTMAQLSLRWLLDIDGVTTIIPGASSAKQALANAAVADLPSLPKELHTWLSDFYFSQVHEHIRGPY